MQHCLKRQHPLTRRSYSTLSKPNETVLSFAFSTLNLPRGSSSDRRVCQEDNTYKIFANHSIDPVTHPIWNSLAWWAALNESSPALPQWWEVLGKATKTCLLPKEELLLSIQAQYCAQSPKLLNK